VLGIGVQLVSIPIVWDVLGDVRLGACLFGFHDGTQRNMTNAFDAGESARGFTVWNTYRTLLLIHAVVGFALMLGLSFVPALSHEVGPASMFLAAGVMFVGQYLFFGSTIYFNARRQFGYLAVTNGAQILLSSVLALVLTLITRRPEAYLAGFAIGNGAVALYSIGSVARQSRGTEGVNGFDREALRYAFDFGKKLYLTRVAAVVTSTFDRIIAKPLGTANIAVYSTAARIPEAGQEVLPVNATVLPDLTKAHAAGPKEFARSVEKNTLTVFGVSCAAILVPCAFAEPVLLLWLGDKYRPEMAWIMVMLGVYAALQMFYTALAGAMIAHGSPQRVLPFTLYSAVALIALAYPCGMRYGIVGLAALRLAIQVAQFVPIIAFTQRTIAPEISLGGWLGRLSGVLALATLFAGGAYASWSLPSVWVPVALLPVASVAFLAVCHATGLSPLPESVLRRLRSLSQRPRTSE
jgi:O-antigen/teichoic acid export membrane protein